MCECYQVGGRFIAEDPECPIHGCAMSQIQREGLSAKDAERLLREHAGVIFGADPIPAMLIEAMQAAGRLMLDRVLEQ